MLADGLMAGAQAALLLEAPVAPGPLAQAVASHP